MGLLGRILRLRWEYARLLGWQHYADFVTANKMIRSASRADDFTRAVANLTSGPSAGELRRLRELKAEATGEEVGRVVIEAFDVSYYSTILRARQYALDSSEVLQYFRYDGVRDGVLSAASSLFGLRFELRANADTWHDDVDVYDVYWATGDAEAIGRFYLDMHPRDDKYKHAAQFTVVERVEGAPSNACS